MNRPLSSQQVEGVVAAGGPLKLLLECNAFYGCADSLNGSWQGPLVGYAKRVKDGTTGREFQMVGKKYYNFALVERQPAALLYFAKLLAHSILVSEIPFTMDTDHHQVLLAAPMGGLDLRCQIASVMSGSRLPFFSQYPEKEITVLKTEKSREKSRLIFKRHRLVEQTNPTSDTVPEVVLVEDCCNNFSTTEEIHDLIRDAGGKLVAIVCAVNRSGQHFWRDLPVLSVIFSPTEQWREDDTIIQDYLRNGGDLVRDPKANWAKLKAAMDEFGTAA